MPINNEVFINIFPMKRRQQILDLKRYSTQTSPLKKKKNENFGNSPSQTSGRTPKLDLKLGPVPKKGLGFHFSISFLLSGIE